MIVTDLDAFDELQQRRIAAFNAGMARAKAVDEVRIARHLDTSLGRYATALERRVNVVTLARMLGVDLEQEIDSGN